MPPVIDHQKCIDCGKCIEVCPTDILREGQGRPRAAYPDECWHCGVCMMDCPTDAIRMSLPLWMRPVTKRVK